MSSAWQEVMKNMLKISQNVFEKSVIGACSKLWRSGVSVLIDTDWASIRRLGLSDEIAKPLQAGEA